MAEPINVKCPSCDQILAAADESGPVSVLQEHLYEEHALEVPPERVRENVAYEVEDPAVWKKFPLSILYTVLLAVLVIAAAALMLIGPRLAAWVAELVGLGDVFTTVWTWARIPAGVVLLILVAALIYYLFPNTGEPFRLITPGAVIAVIVWVVVSLAFSWYAANFASYNAV